MNGPWIIADHYLTMRRWVSFRSKDATIDTIAAWVRFPDMPLKYYDGEILRRMGDQIRRPVRVNHMTTKMLKENLHKVDYEGLRMLCYYCGKFGHSDLECDVRKKEEEQYFEEQVLKISAIGKLPDREHENVKFGPLMIAKKRNRRQGTTKLTANVKQIHKDPPSAINGDETMAGSRYVVLGNEDERYEEIEVVSNSIEVTVGE
ncbi:hypothetical protein REPUB_Repub17cG0079500 [Reevesia pubescens]